MTKRSRFQPEVQAVEPRVLPSSAASRAAFAATGAYPDADRQGLHAEYAAEAGQGTARVIFLGDSLTYYWGDANRPAAGSGWWDARFSRFGADNFGIVGDQTQNLLWRVEHGELAGRPRVAVVLIGINDLLGGRSAKETARHVADVAREVTARLPQTRVLLVGILPTTNPYLNQKAERVNELVKQTRLNARVEFDDVSDRLLKPDGSARQGLYSLGGVHLNASGYHRLGRALWDPIRQLFHAGVKPSR